MFNPENPKLSVPVIAPGVYAGLRDLESRCGIVAPRRIRYTEEEVNFVLRKVAERGLHAAVQVLKVAGEVKAHGYIKIARKPIAEYRDWYSIDTVVELVTS
jgi:hypothetical protein